MREISCRLPSRSGWLELNLLELESFQLEEHLVFSAQADDGQWLDAEACQRLLELLLVQLSQEARHG